MPRHLIVAALVLLSACQNAAPLPAAAPQPTDTGMPAALAPQEILYFAPDGALSAIDTGTGTVRVIAAT